MTDNLDNFIIRGSSAGLVRNEEFLSASDVACPRKTLLRHLKVEETHSVTTQAIFSVGHLFEEWFCAKHPNAEREKLVTSPGLEGHSDLVDETMVWELKSVTSKNTYREVFKKNTPKPQNVVQLLVYLISLERDTGTLVYGSYCHIATYDKLVKMPADQIAPLFKDADPELKSFTVSITEDGFAMVDGAPFYNIHVSEILAFQDNLQELIKTRTLPPRVEALDPSSWASPCKYCKLSILCDSNPSDLHEFVESAKNLYEELEYER